MDTALADNQVEQVLELQDVFKCYEREHRRLKDIIDSCLINDGLPVIAHPAKSTLIELGSNSISGGRRNGSVSNFSGWFNEGLIAAAAKVWGQNKFITNNPRGIVHFCYFILNCLCPCVDSDILLPLFLCISIIPSAFFTAKWTIFANRQFEDILYAGYCFMALNFCRGDLRPFKKKL